MFDPLFAELTIDSISTPLTGITVGGILIYVLKYMVAAMDKQREGFVQMKEQFQQALNNAIDKQNVSLIKHGESIHELAKVQCMLLMKFTEPGSTAHTSASKELERLDRK